MGVLTAWLGSGGEAVEHVEAERRAAICAQCRMNHRDEGWLLRLFALTAAKAIRAALSKKNDLKLETSMDPLLGVCLDWRNGGGCRCILQLKVHTPGDIILKHMKEKTLRTLDPGCWILKL